jgi:general secretion pathway protein A
MYCDYYGFREKPFNITPDPGFVFLSAQHKEAFAHLLYGIDNHVGFIALTGEIGAGKTTVIRTLLGQLASDRYRTALIFNPCLSSLGLMQSINREYGLSGSQSDPAGLLQELNLFLLAENAAGRTVVLVIDEAQNLEPQVLEQVRLISNLETERNKLIQIILVGQPELREILQRPELRQLAQRVGVNYHLRPMDFEDTQEYVAHRLEVAGRRDHALFSAGALRRIFRYSGGLPRLINLACDRSLLAGYTRELTPITAAMAASAIADVRIEEGEKSTLRRLLPAGLVVALLALVAGAIYPPGRKTAATPAPAAAVMSDFSSARQDLANPGEMESLRLAFNPLAGRWRVAPLPRPAPGATAEILARQRGLETLRVAATPAELLRLDTPALLELTLPGGGRRYLAVTAATDGRFSVTPALRGRTSLSAAELASLRPGHAYLFWNNYLGIPAGLKPGARGVRVSRLQGLLHGAGVYSGPLNGRFDRATASALDAFRSAQGIKGNGPLDRQTLFRLYRSGGGSAAPSLNRKGDH